jgi:hypothetical protein
MKKQRQKNASLKKRNTIIVIVEVDRHRSTKAEKQRSSEGDNAGKQKRTEAGKAEKQVKQRRRKSKKQATPKA